MLKQERLSRARALAPQFAALALYAALAVWFTWPIPTDIRHLSGAYDDGPMFLWNLWWFRHALSSPGVSLFHTDYIFRPLGADLYLHTLTPTRGALALPFLPLGVVAANNVLYLLSFVLAGYFSALLARRLVGWWPAAYLAGVVYSFSAYHLARGNGHFNLTEVQWLPLYFLMFLRAVEERAGRFVALAGLVLVLIAYVDLYYFLHAALLSVLCLFARALPLATSRRLLRPAAGRERWLDAALLATVMLMVAILLASGRQWDLGRFKFSVQSLEGPLLWLLVGVGIKAWLLARRGGLDTLGWARERARDAGTLAVALAIAVAGFAPVLIGIRSQLRESGSLLESDDGFRRRFAANVQGLLVPRSINPPPRHDDWRENLWPVSKHWYSSGLEGRVYLGAVALALALVGLWTGRRSPRVRFYGLAALVFLNLSLGPSLHIGQIECWRSKPQSELLLYNWLQNLPVIGAARVASRYAVVVQLAIAMLAAFGIAELAKLLGPGRRRLLGAGLALAAMAVVVWDVYPGRLIPRVLAVPEGIRLIARDPRPGTVLELPLSWSSGTERFGARELDFFFHQTVHERPIFSGHASRYPPQRIETLRRLPLLGTLMTMQLGGDPADNAPIADRAFAQEQEIRWVVVNWDWTPRRRTRGLVRYLRSVLDLTEVHSGDGITVFEVGTERK